MSRSRPRGSVGIKLPHARGEFRHVHLVKLGAAIGLAQELELSPASHYVCTRAGRADPFRAKRFGLRARPHAALFQARRQDRRASWHGATPRGVPEVPGQQRWFRAARGRARSPKRCAQNHGKAHAPPSQRTERRLRSRIPRSVSNVFFPLILLAAMFVTLVVEHFLPPIPGIGARIYLMPLVIVLRGGGAAGVGDVAARLRGRHHVGPAAHAFYRHGPGGGARLLGDPVRSAGGSHERLPRVVGGARNMAEPVCHQIRGSVNSSLKRPKRGTNSEPVHAYFSRTVLRIGSRNKSDSSSNASEQVRTNHFGSSSVKTTGLSFKVASLPQASRKTRNNGFPSMLSMKIAQETPPSRWFDGIYWERAAARDRV